MLRGLYTAAQGLKVHQQRHDIAVNNLSNINTPGFKGDQAIVRTFPEELLYFMGNSSVHPHAPSNSRAATINAGIPPKVGYLAQGVTIEEVIARFAQGPIRETGNSFDLAIVDGDQQQKGFYAVKKELDSQEVVYTRAGNFRLRETDGVQYLATQDGEYLMQRQADGQLQPIPVANENITVFTNGMFEIEDPGFLPVTGQLQLVQFTNDQLPGLTKEGHGLYRVNEQFLGAGFLPEAANNVQVRQRYIEGSNVDPTQAVLDMMTAQRAYEANQKVIQSYDRSLEKAVNEVGRV
jgi:flagellar basal-body rod protein FlgG